MLSSLSKSERLQLMKFVCSFAWADLEVRDAERAWVSNLVRKLKLDESEAKQVVKWLEVPPRAEEVDPASIPRAHRKLFLEVARELIASDGDIATDEAELYAVLEDLLQ